MTDGPEISRPAEDGDPAPDAAPPMLPSRSAFILAFSAVVVAGLFGGVIGFGVADVGTDSDAARLLGTFVGAMIGAAGVGIVAVLVLRAMSEWNRHSR